MLRPLWTVGFVALVSFTAATPVLAQSAADRAPVEPPGSTWYVSDTAVTFEDFPLDGAVVVEASFSSTEGLSDADALAVVHAQITDASGAEIAGSLRYVSRSSIVLWQPAASLLPSANYGGAITFANSEFAVPLGTDVLVQVVVATGTENTPPLTALSASVFRASASTSACCDDPPCELPPDVIVDVSVAGGPGTRLVEFTGTPSPAPATIGGCAMLNSPQLLCVFDTLADAYCVDVTAASLTSDDSLTERVCVARSEVDTDAALPCPTAELPQGCSVVSTTEAPLPLSGGLAALGLLGLVGLARRRPRRRAR